MHKAFPVLQHDASQYIRPIKAAWLVNHVMDCFDSHKSMWGSLHVKGSNRTKPRSICQRL